MNMRVAIFAKLVWLALLLCCLAAAPLQAQELEALFPPEAAGMQLDEVLTGQEAQREIDTLHGKAIQASDAAIATYAAGARKPAMVWVSLAESPLQAQTQVRSMVDKMLAASRSPFHDYRGRNFGGVALHQFLGMGQIHYIWASGRQAWWISAPVDTGDELLAVFLHE